MLQLQTGHMPVNHKGEHSLVHNRIFVTPVAFQWQNVAAACTRKSAAENTGDEAIQGSWSGHLSMFILQASDRPCDQSWQGYTGIIRFHMLCVMCGMDAHNV